MKKYLRITMLFLAIFIGILASKQVNAETTSSVKVEYGPITNGKSEVTITLDDSTNTLASELQKNGWTISGKTAKKTLQQGSGEVYPLQSQGNDNTQFLTITVPIQIKLGTTLSIINIQNLNYTIADTSIATVSGSKITPLKEGTTTLNSKITLNNSSSTPVEVPLSWKLTVVSNSTNTNSGSNPSTTTPTNSDKTTTWTDFSNAKLISSDITTDYTHFTLTLENINKATDRYYYVYLSKNANETISNPKELATDIKKTTMFSFDQDQNKYIAKTTSDNARVATEKAGDTYAYIIEKQGADYKVVKSGVKIDTPAQKVPLGSRMDIYLYDPNKSFIQNKIDISSDRKVSYKIGKVTSNEVLRAFKNEGTASGFSKLLNYVKSTTPAKEGEIATFGDNFSTNLDYNLVKDIDVSNNSYYFLYLSADTNNGKYAPIEDVQIYQGAVAQGQKAVVHFAYGSINVPDEPTNEETPTTTTTNTSKKDNTVAPKPAPKTGESLVIISIVAVLIVICGTTYVITRKYKNIK